MILEKRRGHTFPVLVADESMFGQVHQDLETLAWLDSCNGRDQTPRDNLVVFHPHLHLRRGKNDTQRVT